MSKSLQNLLKKQAEEETVAPREITEVNPEEAEEIAGGNTHELEGPNIACDESC